MQGFLKPFFDIRRPNKIVQIKTPTGSAEKIKPTQVSVTEARFAKLGKKALINELFAFVKNAPK